MSPDPEGDNGDTSPKEVVDLGTAPNRMSTRNKSILAFVCAIAIAIAIAITISTVIRRQRNDRNRQRLENCRTYHRSYYYSDVDINELGNGKCDPKLNDKECEYDWGDCMAWNEKYESCARLNYQEHASYLSINVNTDECFEDYNNEVCHFSAGACKDVDAKYPDCDWEYMKFGIRGGCIGYRDKWRGGDGKLDHCDVHSTGEPFCVYNTKECGWEGGDCLIDGLPNCTSIDPRRHHDGICDSWMNREECDYDGGDCKDFNDRYPGCKAIYPEALNDGECNNDPKSNSVECGYDGGDCDSFNKKYPNCTALDASGLSDGKCNNDPDYNNAECGYDGGDCDSFNKQYPNCTVLDASGLSDGKCNPKPEYNNVECGYDGGDCDSFNKQYPNCPVRYYFWIDDLGNGICDLAFNTTECLYDGGDCL